MTTDKELAPLKKGIVAVSQSVETLTIKNQDDMKVAVEILSQLNKYGDSVKAKKDLLTKPLNLALKNARAMFSPIEEIYEGAVETLRSKMTSYHNEQVKQRKEDEQKIVKRIKEGKGNLSIEKAVEKLSSLPVVEKEIASDEGLVQMRKIKVLKVVNFDLIPREYLSINESLLLKDLKSGKVIPGVELEETSTVVNYR